MVRGWALRLAMVLGSGWARLWGWATVRGLGWAKAMDWVMELALAGVGRRPGS